MKKQIIIFILCALCCALLAAYSAPALAAAREGFYLWRDDVLPALLPFFVCAYIMQNCGVLHSRNRLCLYGLSMVSGAPAGARLAGSQEVDHTDTVAALNAVSPMFICGSFAAGMLGLPALAWPILLAQLLSAAVFLLLARDPLGPDAPAPIGKPKPFLALMSDAIASGIGAMLNIGGAIMCFMALMALLTQTGALNALTVPLAGLCERAGLSPALPEVLFTGVLEMVAGCEELAAASLSLRQTAALGAFFFSFGGICILAQSLAFARLRAGRYLLRKLMQGGLAALLAYLLAPLFLPDAQAVFSPLPAGVLAQNALSAAFTAGISLLCVSVLLLLAAGIGGIRNRASR